MNNLKKTEHFLKPREFYEEAFLNKFSRIVSACEDSKNLIVVIYHLDEDKFLYCNEAFKRIAGKNYERMLESSWSSWYRFVVPEEALLIKTRIRNFLSRLGGTDMLTLRYHISTCLKEKVYIKHEIVLNTLEKATLAINYFYDLSGKEQIEQCFHNGEKACFRSTTSSRANTISPREEQVLKLIADGFSSKQIADKLYISNHTAISHRKHLIEKFRVRNTAQLIKRASKIMEL